MVPTVSLTIIDSLSERKRAKDVPPELHEQWEKDRKKKAENKLKRALERQKIAKDTTLSKKDRKKALRAQLKASRDAEEDNELPGRTPDIVPLEQEIRTFLADINRESLELPPFSKVTRAKVHEIAKALNLKSHRNKINK